MKDLKKSQSRDDNRESDFDRRGFLYKSAGAGLALSHSAAWAVESADGPLPTRILGRTGERVTVLGLGTAPVGEGPPGVQEAVKIFGAALDAGVTYVDTARGYGNAEEALGHLLPKRRDDLFVVTKCWTDSAAGGEESLSESLRQLKTDHVDLVHIHNIGGKDVDKVLAKDGILNYLIKQKEVGKLRFIGISGHESASRFLRLIETDQVDVMMTVLNYADRNIYEFESKVLPEARRRNLGVVAMKAYGGIKGGFPNHKRAHVGCVTQPHLLGQALAYTLDLEGVSAAVVGPYTVEQSIQNVELARQYKPLTNQQRESLLALGREIAPDLGPRYGPVA